MVQEKRILITGGAGFIGSNLVEHFLSRNNQVICLDNFYTGKKENIQPFLNHPNFKLIVGDIRDIEVCYRAVKDVDVILHQAALGSVPRSVRDPKSTNDVNIGGFINILVAARDNGVRRIVYASSSSVYGDSPTLPKMEEQLGKPISPYGITKLVNEMYAEVFSALYGLETIGLRYFNVFGPRQDPDGPYAAAIPKFIRQLLKHEAPVIYGDGNQSRDFTYVDNVILANELAAGPLRQEALNTCYNIAFGESTTINQLVEALKNHLSQFDPRITEIQPVYAEPRQGDILHSRASVDKARNLLGYHPQYNFSEGLKKAIRWYWENLK